jgi:hypothetical protein
MKADNGSHRHNPAWIMRDMVANYPANFVMGIFSISVIKLAFGSRALAKR